MTINSIIIRFLKDNGYYSFFSKEALSYQRRNPSFSLKGSDGVMNMVKMYNFYYLHKDWLTNLFYNLFSNKLIFMNDSINTNRRRKFYNLNRKWKDFIANNRFILQHNFKIGQNVTYDTLFRDIIGRIKDIKGDRIILGDFYCKSIVDDYFLEKNKEFVSNIYIVKNGVEYGKLKGDFEEVQLQ